MAVITDTYKDEVYWVWISCGKWTDKHYENLGYEIPKAINKNGKLVSPRGTKILVNVEHLFKGSEVRVIKVCDLCGDKTKNLTYAGIISCRNQGDGLDRCKKCSNIKIGKTQIENMSFDKSIASKFPEIEKTWHPTLNGNLTPDKVYAYSSFVYWWVCLDCGSDYDTTSANRANNHNCPYCAGRRVNETNCLWATHPEIVKILWNLEDSYKYTAGSHTKADFKCLDCGYKIKNKEIKSVINQGISCPRCSDGISYPEKFMSALLIQLGIDFEFQKTFEWSKNIMHTNEKLSGNKIFDFFIPSMNSIIEVHGIQHYNGNFAKYKNGRTLENERENDKIKKELAKNNEIRQYYVIDCSISEIKYIKNNIINGELANAIELKDIDWMSCHRYACNSLVKTACDLWNNGVKSTTDIGEKLKINGYTVSRYLKQGVKIGWCDYNLKDVWKNRSLKISQKTLKSVVQLKLDGTYIEEYKSINDASIKLGIHASNISSVVGSGRNKSAGGFKWMYKSEHEKQIQSN